MRFNVSFCVSRLVACDCNYDCQQPKAQLRKRLLNFRVRMFVKSAVRKCMGISLQNLYLPGYWA